MRVTLKNAFPFQVYFPFRAGELIVIAYDRFWFQYHQRTIGQVYGIVKELFVLNLVQTGNGLLAGSGLLFLITGKPPGCNDNAAGNNSGAYPAHPHWDDP